MENKRLQGWCLVLAAGTVLGASGALAASGPVQTERNTADDPRVAATFDANGAFDNDGIIKADLEASRSTQAEPIDEAHVAAKRAAMDAELAAVFANAPLKSDAVTPNYRYLRGVAVPMHLDTFKLVVKAGGEEAARLAAGKAGIVVAAEGHRTVNGYTIVALAQPIGDLKTADAAIQRIVNSGVAFAGPVFQNPFIEGGFYIPTDRALVRVNQGLNAAAVAARTAADFVVTNASLGSMDGAM